MKAGHILVNGIERAWSGGSLLALLAASGVDAARPGIAIAVNGRVVSRAQWSERDVRPGDDVEIVGATAGG